MMDAEYEEGGGLEAGEAAGLVATDSGDRRSGLFSKRLSSSEALERRDCMFMCRNVEGCELA